MTASFRPMEGDADRDFVISTWSSSWRKSKWAGLISMRNYPAVMHAEIAWILDRPSTRVIVADEPGEVIETEAGPRPWLYGFIATRVDLGYPYVYYVYVKRPFRRGRTRLGLEAGYATQLFAAAGIDPLRPFTYACRTNASEALTQDRYADGGGLIPRRIPRANHDLFPARYEEPDEQRQDSQARSEGRGPHSARQVRHQR